MNFLNCRFMSSKSFLSTLCFLCIFTLGAFCKKEQDWRYVGTLPGITGFTDPERKSVGELIPFSAKIMIRNKLGEKVNATNGAIPVQWRERFLWISKDSLLSEKKPESFLLVNAQRGLNLREAPDIGSKILSLLPLNTISVIDEVHPKLEKIDDVLGYWLKTEFADKTGWVFSAYVVTSHDKKELESTVRFINFEDGYFSELFQPREIIFDKPPEDRSHTLIRKLSFKNFYEISEISFEKTDYCEPQEILRIENKRTGNFTYFDGQLLKNDSVGISDAVFFYSRSCRCCCDTGSQYILLSKGDRLYELPILVGKQEPRCENPEESMNMTELRYFSESKELYFFIKQSICDYSEETPEKAFKGFSDGRFLRIRLEKEYDLEEIKTQTIPLPYLEKWNRSKIVRIK